MTFLLYRERDLSYIPSHHVVEEPLINVKIWPNGGAGMVMTWGEFKKAVEELGVKNDDELDLVDYDSEYHSHSSVAVSIIVRENGGRLVLIETA